jgi:hypothetical protein
MEKLLVNDKNLKTLEHVDTVGNEPMLPRHDYAGHPSGDDVRLLTVEDVAKRLQVQPSWIYRHSQILGAFKCGKYLRFRWSRVLESLEKLSR